MTQNTIDEAEDKFERVIVSSLTSIGNLSKLLTTEENVRVHEGDLTGGERSLGYMEVFNETFCVGSGNENPSPQR